MTEEQRRLSDRVTTQGPEVADLLQMELGFRAALTWGEAVKAVPLDRRSQSLRLWRDGSLPYGLKKDISSVTGGSWNTREALARWRARLTDPR